jgi:hypothetical protein
MFITLRGLGDHTLKADESLIDTIMKLKVDCSEIQEYLHVSQYDSLVDTSRIYALKMIWTSWYLCKNLKRLNRHAMRDGSC